MLRWLAAPSTVLALVVLLLNDHVLKHEFPGAVTGKVSDVAGLLVAAPLLALVASLARLPRPRLVGITLTAAGFVAMKTSDLGADLASTLWSTVTPSHVVADPTDLLALPVLGVAWRVAHRAAREAVDGHPRRARLALLVVVLPATVVATSATSACQEHTTVRRVLTVTGGLASTPPGQDEDLLVEAIGIHGTLDTGGLVRLSQADGERADAALDGVDPAWRSTPQRQVCSRSQPLWCWRVSATDPDDSTEGTPYIDQTVDGGARWGVAFGPTEPQRDEVLDGIGERCGEPARFAVDDLTVVETPGGPVVAAGLTDAGVAVRSPGGAWTRLGPEQLERTDGARTPGPDDPRGPLAVVGAPLVQRPDESPSPTTTPTDDDSTLPPSQRRSRGPTPTVVPG